MKREMINGYRHYIGEDGIKYPSVTSILSATKPPSPALEAWKKRIGGQEEADKVLKEAGDRGSMFHSAMEDLLLKGILCNPESPIADYFKQVYPTYTDKIISLYMCEERLWHPEGFAGTCDLVAEMDNGQIALIDWKSATKPKKEEYIEDYILQVSAYLAALDNRWGHHIKINRCDIVVATTSSLQVFSYPAEQLLTEYYPEFVNRLKEFNHVSRTNL